MIFSNYPTIVNWLDWFGAKTGSTIITLAALVYIVYLISLLDELIRPIIKDAFANIKNYRIVKDINSNFISLYKVIKNFISK